jgi:hypothetical protein
MRVAKSSWNGEITKKKEGTFKPLLDGEEAQAPLVSQTGRKQRMIEHTMSEYRLWPRKYLHSLIIRENALRQSTHSTP